MKVKTTNPDYLPMTTKVEKCNSTTKRNAIKHSNRFFILFVFVAIINSISCSQSSESYNTEHIIQGIPCKGDVNYFFNHKLRRCTLSKDYTYDGFTMPSGSLLYLFKSGTPEICEISREASFNGLLLPANSKVMYNIYGQKTGFWLAEKRSIQGVMIAHSWDGITNKVHKNGKLKAVWLAEEQEIEGVPCTSSMNIFIYGMKALHYGTKRMAFFYENGKLQQAMISKDIEIQGISFKKGELICFDKEGKIDRNAKLCE